MKLYCGEEFGELWDLFVSSWKCCGLADQADGTDRWRKDRSLLPPPLVAMVREEVKCVETAIVSKVKSWLNYHAAGGPALCPHLQVINSAGLPVHTGRAIILHQPPSSAQQVEDLTWLIDLSGQWPCVTILTSLITSWISWWNQPIIVFISHNMQLFHS